MCQCPSPVKRQRRRPPMRLRLTRRGPSVGKLARNLALRDLRCSAVRIFVLVGRSVTRSTGDEPCGKKFASSSPFPSCGRRFCSRWVCWRSIASAGRFRCRSSISKLMERPSSAKLPRWAICFRRWPCSAPASLDQATIFGLGIMPYISASIIFQLLGSVWGPLERLQKEGESGRKKINEYTRYATVVFALGKAGAM